MFSIKNITFLFAVLLFAASCEPVQDPEIELPVVPETANFTAVPAADNPNLIIVTDLSSGFFNRLWEFPGGTPSTSNKAVDSIFYSSAGDYTITLHVAAENGGGTTVATQEVSIAEDAVIECDEQVALLTGDCSAEGKCWVFSPVAGAITVGPTAGSGEWFTSPEGGLVPEQYDDKACFLIEGLVYDYRNNGQTVNPWEGFEAQDFTPPAGQTWSFTPNGGTDGLPQINLGPDGFMGVRDSGPLYDVVSLTETELVVRARFRNADGTTPDEGWFELYFIAE